MGQNFTPVELESIEQGDFLLNGRETFKQMNKQLIAHVNEFEGDATATLTMKVDIKYNAKSKGYVIVTDVDKKLPKKPKVATTAFVADEDGSECLFANKVGTGEGNAAQMVLCDNKGNAIKREPVTA